MDYYDTQTLIEDLKVILKHKEYELAEMITRTPKDLSQSVKLQQLMYEINELKTQVRYHENKIANQMMNRCNDCTNCSNGSCRYKYWTKE